MAAVGGSAGVCPKMEFDEVVQAQFVKLCAGEITDVKSGVFGGSRVFPFQPEGSKATYVVKRLDEENISEVECARETAELGIGPEVFFTHVLGTAGKRRGIIVMQHYPRDLFAMLVDEKPLPFIERIKLVHKVACLVFKLHAELDVPHLDLKPENIVCEEDGSDPRLIDFQKRSRGGRIRFTLEYSPPEKLERSSAFPREKRVASLSPRSEKEGDVYALGVILLEAASLGSFRDTCIGPRRTSAAKVSVMEMYEKVRSDEHTMAIAGEMFLRSEVPAAQVKAVKKVAQLALWADPKKRVKVPMFVRLLDGLVKKFS